MKIEIYSQLSEDILKFSMTPAEFRMNFYEMKSGYPPDFFGRDVRNENSELINHVHIIPDETDSRRKSWAESCSVKGNPFHRTSDDFLYYADYGNSYYLLIAIVKPRGHKSLNNIDFMWSLENIAITHIKK